MIQLKKIISTAIVLKGLVKDEFTQCPSPILKKNESLGGDNIQLEVMDYVMKPTSFVTYHHFTNVGEDIYRCDFKFPIPQGFNSYSEQVELKVVPFAKRYGLYQGMEDALDKFKFAWLPSFLDPYLSQKGMEGTTFYYVTLFAHDDDIDLYSSTGDINPDPLAKINNKIEKIMSGQIVDTDQDARLTAIKDIYKIYFAPIIDEKRYDFSFGLESLHQYLQSTVLEASHIQSGVSVSEGLYLHNRQHTGGIRHALSILCLYEDIDISGLLKKYLILDFILRQVSDCVGVLNDVFSFPKEIKEIKKKISSVGNDPSNIDLIKSKVTSNLVLIKWRDGLSISDSITYSINKYDETLHDFYLNKEQLKNYFSEDIQLAKLMFIMEGWMFGHPAWSLNSGRYGASTILSNETATAFLNSLETLV